MTEVPRNYRADPTMHTTLPPKNGCRCRNHLGQPKQQHKTKDAALTAIMKRHLRHGAGFEVYRCPKADVWHVRTQRK